MAPRKPNPASAKGPDPGRVDDDSTAFLGVSLVDDVELAKLVELPQLSPSALVWISIFDWACRTSGFEPSTKLFGTIFFATVNLKTVITPAGTKKTVFGSVNFNVRPERSDLWPVNAAMSKWDRHWMARWFYHTIPFEAGSDSAKALRCRCRAIAPNRKPKIAVDGAMEARLVLLRKLAPRKRRVPTSSVSDADDEDDAEERDGEEEGEEEEEVEAVAEKATNEAIDDRVDTPGYTPTPSPGHNETVVKSNSSPLQRKDLEGAKALVAFSSGKAAKVGPVKKISKKKGLVDIAHVFSDDESSDETPTSPDGRSLDLSTAPLLPLGVARVGGSAAAGASASAEWIVTATARVFGSPLREPAVSPLVKTKGKGAAAEASASEYSLAVPHFAPGDFETRADLIPFVEGVSNLVLPAGTPSLFTELNEFDEGCSAIKSLAVRILAAHCSTQRTAQARHDGFKNRLRAKDDEISRKNLEVDALANTLKEAKAEVKCLQSKLEKGKEARAEVDRLKAELEKGREAIAEVDRLQTELKEEKAHSTVLTDYYNLTEPKMEDLRLKVSKAEASAVEESQRFSREMAKTTESARTACQTLRLALTDMGTKFGCEHVAEFPDYAKGDWEISAQNISPALHAWRKQFWQKDGWSAAKARLLEQLAKAEAADRCEEEDATGEEVGGDAQDQPERQTMYIRQAAANPPYCSRKRPFVYLERCSPKVVHSALFWELAKSKREICGIEGSAEGRDSDYGGEDEIYL
uniref:Uncharacterized protein n=2 Tax=Oryza sativa subsp. japonica TaxID=39947 RepID=Q10IN1_ORYSJ|nr:hypothetical protein [Oryza sativa Japonica Group]ABF96958.1 hypothetical protein LOC_Os03g33690 [Oryza sativa Japonica Group]